MHLLEGPQGLALTSPPLKASPPNMAPPPNPPPLGTLPLKAPPVFRLCDGPKAKGRPVIRLTPDNGPPARKAVPVPKAGSPPGALPKSRLPENAVWAQTAAWDAPWDLYDPPQGFPYLGIEESEWPTLLESLHKRTPHAVGFKTKMPKPWMFTDNKSGVIDGTQPKKAFYLRVLGQGRGQTNPVYDAPPFEGKPLVKKLPCGLVVGPIGDVTHIDPGYVVREDGKRTCRHLLGLGAGALAFPTCALAAPTYAAS